MRGAHEEQALASAAATMQDHAAVAARCQIVLALLRDAGADDLAARITVVAADALYRELVQIVGAAVQKWFEGRDTIPAQQGGNDGSR